MPPKEGSLTPRVHTRSAPIQNMGLLSKGLRARAFRVWGARPVGLFKLSARAFDVRPSTGPPELKVQVLTSQCSRDGRDTRDYCATFS